MSCPLCHGRGMVESPGDWRENGGWEECPMCHPPAPKSDGWVARLWKRFKARFRLDLAAVCEMSKGRGLHDDFHDYPDSDPPYPWHFHTHKCRRCGKEFTI